MGLLARGLGKRYGGAQGYAAVTEASLDLPDGDFVAIVGRSGSGKSTLLAMLGALTEPDDGQVLLDGTDLWAMPEADRAGFRSRHIGFVFQFASLLPNLAAVDNVALPALLGRTMAPGAAYARAQDLLARVGLADRAEAFPGTLSGGEQRRVAIARALINAPRLLLADEPTSDLDEDTEAGIFDLLADLQTRQGFGLLLVTHNLDLARRAPRIYEMRQGVLRPAALGEPAPVMARTPVFGPALIEPRADAEAEPVARAPVRLGAGFRRGLRHFALGTAAVFALVLLADFAAGKYQAMRMQQRGERLAALQELALSTLQGEVQSVTDLGEGRYELALSLWDAGEQPIYVMAPEMRGYVQVGTLWQEIPLHPAGDSAAGVRRIDGRQTWRYVFEARVKDYAQLLPYYMHVRFSGTMLVSPDRVPKDDVFERQDNYYVYLKPFDVPDEAVLKRMRFAGRPPVWIPMPPH